jgi:hypothetical protein
LDCPNCGSGHKLVWKTDGTGVCGSCNGTFTPGPESKLVADGEFDEVKGRVAKLEKENDELRGLLRKPTEAKPAEPKAEGEDTKGPEDEEDV